MQPAAIPAARTLEQLVPNLAFERADHALAQQAKLIASAIFVQERDLDDFLNQDLSLGIASAPPADLASLRINVDEARRRVTVAAPDGLARTAVYHDGLGCTILPRGVERVFFEPVPVIPNLPTPDSQPWPMGDILPERPVPGVDHAALQASLDDLIADEEWPTRALVVLHRGELAGERYAPGFGPHSRHQTWSCGKSIAATLIGLLVKDGHLAIDDYAPIEEWHGLDDPRRMIRTRNLLNMSSGLLFRRAGQGDPPEIALTHLDDHIYIYFGAIDVAAHSISRPLEFPPNTVWRYRNCDTLALGAIVRRTVEARGEPYLTYPQRALFDKLGIRSIVLEPDPWGNFVLTGYDHGTARDWARFALLYLQDGVWQGERLLPEGWAELVSTPAPADPSRAYGGQFWLNAGGRLRDVPRDAYWAAGATEKIAMVIPSRDTVVVYFGRGTGPDRPTFAAERLNDAVARILATLDGAGR